MMMRARGAFVVQVCPAVLEQRRCAIGEGGPGFTWKRTLLADRYRRESPLKRRRDQHKMGKKMEEPKPQQHARWPAVLGERDLTGLFGVRFAAELPWAFLVDREAARTVMKSLGSLRERVVVVAGAGMGLLCEAAVEAGARKVVALEKDERWIERLGEIERRSNGVVKPVLGDAITCNFEELLEELGDDAPSAQPWEGMAEVVLLSALPFGLRDYFCLRMIAHCSARIGLFSYGRVRVGIIQPRSACTHQVAPPSRPEFNATSVQVQALFEPQLAYVMNPRSFAGPLPKLAGAEANPPCLLTLEPLVTPRSSLPAEALHLTATKLFQGFLLGKKRHAERRPSILYDMLAKSVGEGNARRVLDLTSIDGGLSPTHLSQNDVFRLVEAVAHVAPPSSQGQDQSMERSIEELVEKKDFRHHSQSSDSDGWDPLFEEWSRQGAR
eukprot:Hpha_TRINITY_DN16119_c4_g4::TRINITY_DN16119_c4_g4_i1::g.3877::m.3877/K15266/TFB1M; dimethyladenosine transferase 1, mitochondrial